MKKKLLTTVLSVAMCASAFSAVTLLANAEETAPTNSYVIAAVTGDSETGFVTEAEWAVAEEYMLVGESTTEVSVKFATVGSNLFFRMTAEDTTKFTNNDRLAFVVKMGDETLVDLQGNFAPWFSTASPEATVQSEFNTSSNVDSTVPYTYTYGIALGEKFVRGTELDVVFAYNDATTAETKWGEGAALQFVGKLSLGVAEENPGEGGETTDPDQPTDPESQEDYILPLLTSDITAADWENAKAYEMTALTENTTGATGNVKVVVANGKLHLRMEVEDATMLDNDRPDFSITVGDKVASARGKYWDSTAKTIWLADRPLEAGYSAMAKVGEASVEHTDKWVLTITFELGAEYAVSGAHIQVKFSHADAQTAENAWTDNPTDYPHAIGFEHTLYLGEYSETDKAPQPEIPDQPDQPDIPETTPGPENVDLGIVVVDLPTMPKESDWANATAYSLIPNNGNLTGATATVKIFTAAANIFFRLEVSDPTVDAQNDGIYFYIGNEDCNLETRGNYNEAQGSTVWLSHLNNNLGSPSLLALKNTASNYYNHEAGVYTLDVGYYIPDLYAAGNSIHFVVKHRDSRSSSETWGDNDYAHTVYLDQTITFGEEADTTVRPQTPTAGFTGSTADISYNKANVTWTEFSGAETYKMYVYSVNAEESAEPYTHLSIEGPIYSGMNSYSEQILGLTQSTKYVVQIVAYDNNGEAIAYSELVQFSTISRQEALNPDSSDAPVKPGTSDTPDTPDSSKPADTNSSERGGCFGVASIGSTLVFAAMGVTTLLAKKKEQN